MRRALAAHPGIAAITLRDPDLTEEALLLIENLMGILLASGFELHEIDWVKQALEKSFGDSGEIRRKGNWSLIASRSLTVRELC